MTPTLLTDERIQELLADCDDADAQERTLVLTVESERPPLRYAELRALLSTARRSWRIRKRGMTCETVFTTRRHKRLHCVSASNPSAHSRRR